MKKVTPTLLLFFFSAFACYSNQRTIDSLLQVAENSNDIKIKADRYLDVGNIYKYSDLNKAAQYTGKSLELYKQIGELKDIAVANSELGTVKLLANDLGSATDLFLRTKEIGEEIDHVGLIANGVGGLASVYMKEGNHEKAITHYKNAVIGYELDKDTLGLTGMYNNLGICYRELGQLEEAEVAFTKGVELAEAIGETRNKSSAMINLATIYYSQNKVDLALQTNEELLVELYEQGNYRNATGIHSNLARMYDEQGNKQKAKENVQKAISLAEEKDFIAFLPVIYYTAYIIYNSNEEYKEAIYYLRKNMAIRDSMNAINVNTLESKLDMVENEKELKKSKAEKELAELMVQSQKSKNMVLIGGLSLSVILIALLYFLFHNKKKTNQLINRQKEQLEEKNNEITDSINYAKVLQNAILCTTDTIAATFPEHFVLFKPKDIVSGDFYWFHSKGEWDFIAAADCTGHGVPGAFVSMVCNNALDQVVIADDVNDAGEILTKTSQIVSTTYRKQGARATANDGMDIAFCAINKQRTKALFAGALRPLIMVRKGELIEQKGDRVAIGGDSNHHFTTHEIPLQPGDTLYMFSDGFHDQFGGEKGKKFKYANFKALLKDMGDTPMAEQAALLEKKLVEWKGDLEQLDDVCIVGVRV